MTAVLGYGLLAVGLWCLAAFAVCCLIAHIVRGLSRSSSRLVLVQPSREVGPADPKSAGPSHFTTP